MEFTKEFFSGNRRRLIEVTSAPLIVLTANGLLQRSADTTYPFRQDSNFWYLTGAEEPDYILVMTQEDTFLIAPRRPEHRDMWDGMIDKSEISRISGIEEIVGHIEGWNRLDRLIKKYKKIHTIAPFESYYERFGFYSNPARGVLLQALQKHRSAELSDVRKILASMRQVKQPVELSALRKAIDITDASINDVKQKLRSYKTEYEVVADITAGFIAKGATGHAYQPIVASGINATTIHYIRCNDIIADNDLLLFDVGAEVNNYSADISRTYSLKKPDVRQISVHSAVVRVQAAAFKLLKPGVNMKIYEQAVDELMAVELKELGLLSDINDKKKLKKYYPHLASHFLGLDAHDAADYEKLLQPGMVLTVEPGIYIPEERIGIRIEDNVLITETGNDILSAALPSTLL